MYQIATDECSRCPESVFTIPGIHVHHGRNGCSPSPESLFTFRRNPCSPCPGIGVQDGPEYAASLRLDFLKENRNVVLVAPQGLGKTMIAQNIAHEAILKGHSVLFLSAAQLLLDLAGKESARALDARFRYYSAPSLIVVDEIGYLSFDNRNADLLFQIVSRRYERRSLVLTTNLAFSAWPTIFPNATCATALIDRVIHHADVIAIEGESYRLREAAEAAKRARKGKAGK